MGPLPTIVGTSVFVLYLSFSSEYLGLPFVMVCQVRVLLYID